MCLKIVFDSKVKRTTLSIVYTERPHWICVQLHLRSAVHLWLSTELWLFVQCPYHSTEQSILTLDSTIFQGSLWGHFQTLITTPHQFLYLPETQSYCLEHWKGMQTVKKFAKFKFITVGKCLLHMSSWPTERDQLKAYNLFVRDNVGKVCKAPGSSNLSTPALSFPLYKWKHVHQGVNFP